MDDFGVMWRDWRGLKRVEVYGCLLGGWVKW